ncbi:unnamed protein product [Brassicogethes aeneus]|uniref:Uncharacterized protein n=1 Tax=Brassicogethes aeneus TaxID=1431903 RepID=A0A9P0B730_BRAAE|nr:unnamed protein product [Brassicogethes aeneus]
MDTTDAWRTYATICRLCLQKDGFMLGIFNHIQGKDKSIYKKIIDCTALQITFGDGLPNVICHRCLYKVEFCLEFRQLCFMSDATLRQINGVSGPRRENGFSQIPLYEQLGNANDEDVVMVVDPTALDYDSEFESDNERQSDNDALENNDYDCKNISMCKFCDHAFTDKNECFEHESVAHNNEIPYSCSECSMDFSDRLQYSAHLKSVHQNDKPYNCPQCDKTFARRSDLRKHTVVHTGIKPFTCTVCSKSFSRNTNLSKHMRIHSGQKPFVCSKCPKTFISKGDLTRHGMIHSGQKPFHCNYCNLSFARKDKLLRHEKKHFVQDSTDKTEELQNLRENLGLEFDNVNSNQSECFAEEKTAEGSENMVINLDPFNHNNFNSTPNRDIASESEQNDVLSIQKQDSDVAEGSSIPQVPAHITGDSFSNGTLANGKPAAIKNHQCTICNRRFLTPDNLRYHHASHTGIRPFSCSTCNKSFIRKRELDRHIVTHTGMRPFKCTKCNKSFGRKDKLVRHMRIHDVNREHSCLTCGALFSRKDALIQHSKVHVKEEIV